MLRRLGQFDDARDAARAASRADHRWCQALRLEDVAVLREAIDFEAQDLLAPLLLGNWLYDRGRARDAIEAWNRVALGDRDELAVIAERNLGIAAYNVAHDMSAASDHYERARALRPRDARLLFEADQLAARRGDPANARLRLFEAQSESVDSRDDLVVTRAELLVALDQPDAARALLTRRVFQPWEGGEGAVLRAWEATTLALARRSLATGDIEAAARAIAEAFLPPASLGEARHPLANVAELHLVLGDVLDARGDVKGAREAWEVAALSTGDFTRMSAARYSAQTVWSIYALHRLGRLAEAEDLAQSISAWLDDLASAPATVDYFATSLPNMLLFIDDPRLERQQDIDRMRRSLAEVVDAQS